MNINDKDKVLGLALGSTNYNAETRLNGSSGAGVNANSRVDIAFAASDPLSELVWSPHKGLSLKCADSSMASQKHFDPRNARLTIKDLSTSQSIRSKGSGDEKVGDEKKLTLSNPILHGDAKLADKATLSRSSRGSSSPDLDASHGIFDAEFKSNMDEEGSVGNAILEGQTKDNREEDLSSSHNVQIADAAECSKKNAEQDNLADGTNDSKVNVNIKWEFSSKLIRTRCTQNSRLDFKASSSDVKGLAVPIHSEPHAAKLSKASISSLPNLVSQKEPDDELTSSSRDMSENKTRKPISIPAPALMILESSAENDLGYLTVKDAQSSGEVGLPRESSHPVDRSPTNSRFCSYQEKGKEKALSDGNIRARSDDEDDSRESAESCNSAGLFSKGIKRQTYDQEHVAGSKRLKKEIRGSNGSTSFVRPDSSFMNWISKMVKGPPDSNKELCTSLSLTLARSNDGCGDNHQEDFMSNKSQDCESQKLGFQTMFQSLYCRNMKIPKSGRQNDNCSIDESKELMVADKESHENVPRLCDRNNDNICKKIVLCNTEANRHISRNILDGLFSTDFSCTPYACGRSLAKNKGISFPVCNRAKGEGSPSDSLCKQLNSTAENAIVSTPLATNSMPEKSRPLSSLWITRLYTRTATLENCNQITEEAPECSTEYPKASIDFKSTHKLNSIQLPQKLRTTEAMASVFAKRMIALRHIMHPSEKTMSSTCTQLCFFCGGSGHDLLRCPELKETELEDLLVKLSALDNVEECSCFCIRCFQFDHWASSCPLVFSQWPQRQRRSQQNACSHHSTCHPQLCDVIDGGEEVDRKQVSAGHMASNVKGFSTKSLPSSNEFQNSTASYSENDLKNLQKFSPFNFISAQHAVAHEVMFHAITKLRLSRADVIRWMDSNVSLSHLSGFFLRVRLAKFEAGLGGTGYYAARITGDKMENIGCKVEKSILVDVGGIKSSVGSQYVSNHDFLEDEIKAWWSRTVKTGGYIPSLDELNSKFEERKCLGF